MKKALIILVIVSLPVVFVLGSRKHDDAEPIAVTPSAQRPGDAAKGYEYLTTGDFIKSGVPYSYFTYAAGQDKNNYLNRTGKNATVAHGYNVIEKDGIEMVIPTCMQCHSQVFEGKLVIGLGNNSLDFSNAKSVNYDAGLQIMQRTQPKVYKASKPFFTSFKTTVPLMETEVRGVNTADRLAMILVAHRDPQTLKWSDTALIPLPDEIIPTDVPAWWLMKKKNAMFYSGFARGDFAKYLMLSNLLTVTDTAEAKEVSNHFGDVLAYIRSLEPPKYPHTVDKQKAETGRLVFNENCSSCHGTYGDGGQYPNLLIPYSIIQTDSMLAKSLEIYAPFLDWFRKSWFAQGENAPYLVPFFGYIAPPLDGVWVTAPYMHNGSVPTIEALLNSKTRPEYWSRDFDKPEYDYVSVGWKHTAHPEPVKKKTYNTKLQGYSNSGHTFGDHLNDQERSAVIEYLKTL